MRRALARLIRAVPQEDIPTYFFERVIAADPSMEKTFVRVVEGTHRWIQAIHPEYRSSTIDRFVLLSFSKRFLGSWITAVNHKHRKA